MRNEVRDTVDRCRHARSRRSERLNQRPAESLTCRGHDEDVEAGAETGCVRAMPSREQLDAEADGEVAYWGGQRPVANEDESRGRVGTPNLRGHAHEVCMGFLR